MGRELNYERENARLWEESSSSGSELIDRLESPDFGFNNGDTESSLINLEPVPGISSLSQISPRPTSQGGSHATATTQENNFSGRLTSTSPARATARQSTYTSRHSPELTGISYAGAAASNVTATRPPGFTDISAEAARNQSAFTGRAPPGLAGIFYAGVAASQNSVTGRPPGLTDASYAEAARNRTSFTGRPPPGFAYNSYAGAVSNQDSITGGLPPGHTNHYSAGATKQPTRRPGMAMNQPHTPVNSQTVPPRAPFRGPPVRSAVNQNVSQRVSQGPSYTNQRTSPQKHLQVIPETSANTRPRSYISGRGRISLHKPYAPDPSQEPNISTEDAEHSRSASSGNRSQRPSIFAKPEGLVSTRLFQTRQIKSDKEERQRKFLGEPHQEERLGAIGYYLWPVKGQNPMHFLGLKLEDLDHIRIEFRVWIIWDVNLYCLVVSSLRGNSAEDDVTKAIQGIRQNFQNAKAQKISSIPLYIIVPPTPDAMRSIVQPKKYDGKDIIIIEFAGEPLNSSSKEKWEAQRSTVLNNNNEKFTRHLVKHLQSVSPMKGWMRMRVHFGHLNMTRYPKDFGQGKKQYQDFVDIMGDARAQAAARFDKRLLDVNSAVELKDRIIKMPEKFCLFEGPTFPLEDVTFHDTVCIFFHTKQGIPIRVEADIDRNSEGEYQMGSTRHFRNNRRNKHLEIITVDIEGKVDWALELITDNTIKEPEPEWQSLVIGCVDAKSPELTDSLGLKYPKVVIRGFGDIPIDTLIVRSVIQYKLRNSGNAVELSIYREWQGRNTNPEPTVLTSVTMYHPMWDYEMRSIEDTTSLRAWSPDLRELFNQGDEETHGIENFIADVETIGGYISEASHDFFKNLS